MVVTCPDCGARNRVSEVVEPGKAYHCYSCKAKLARASEAVSAEGLVDVDVRVDGARHLDGLPARPQASRSAFDGVLARILERERHLILLLVLLTLGLQLLMVPFRGDALVYDELHYVPEARSIIAEGEFLNPEHPPLSKLFITAGITVFGDNQWGWRVPSVLFGVTLVVLFYLVCRELVGRGAGLVAAGLFASETLVFNFSGLAMLDVFSVTFMFLAFLFYLRHRYVLSGASLALAGLCKMTGLLGGIVLIVHWLVFRRRQQSPRTIGLFAVSAFVAFVALMPLLDYAATQEWANPFARLWLMTTTHGGISFDELPPGWESAQAYPWEWLLNPIAFVWPGHLATIQVSWTVWVLIIPSMVFMGYEIIKRRTQVSLFVIVWFAATYLVWIPLVLATDRLTYYFYFYPTVGAVCLAVGYCAAGLWQASSQRRFARHGRRIRGAVVSYFVLHLIFFMVFTPVVWALESHLGILPQG